MKTALITGASRGIGQACAIWLAAAGYAVGIGYNKSEDEAQALCKLIADHGGIALPCPADVANDADVQRMSRHFLSELSHIDVLVTAAGVSIHGLFCDDAASWDSILSVNLTGTANTCRAVLPSMISRKQGAIITISSIWGLCGASCEAAYSASKAGIIGLTKSLAREVGPSGVRVNCVAPGLVDTDMTAALSESDRAIFVDNTPLSRAGLPQDVAAAVAFLASEDASFITGAVLPVDGGYTA